MVDKLKNLLLMETPELLMRVMLNQTEAVGSVAMASVGEVVGPSFRRVVSRGFHMVSTWFPHVAAVCKQGFKHLEQGLYYCFW